MTDPNLYSNDPRVFSKRYSMRQHPFLRNTNRQAAKNRHQKKPKKELRGAHQHPGLIRPWQESPTALSGPFPSLLNDATLVPDPSPVVTDFGLENSFAMESMDFLWSPMELTFRLHFARQAGQNSLLDCSGLVSAFKRPLGPCNTQLDVCVCQTYLN